MIMNSTSSDKLYIVYRNRWINICVYLQMMTIKEE